MLELAISKKIFVNYLALSSACLFKQSSNTKSWQVNTNCGYQGNSFWTTLCICTYVPPRCVQMANANAYLLTYLQLHTPPYIHTVAKQVSAAEIFLVLLQMMQMIAAKRFQFLSHFWRSMLQLSPTPCHCQQQQMLSVVFMYVGMCIGLLYEPLQLQKCSQVACRVGGCRRGAA